jgi:exosome complex RNA-binding protein Rrp4
VRIIGQGIQKQIRKAQPRKMLVGGANKGRKYDPFAGDSLILRRALEIANGWRVHLRQPKHAVLDAGEQPHPEVKHLGRDLVEIVEGGEDEARVG